MFGNKSTKNILDEKETNMTSINSFLDAEAFSGKVVAFKTTSNYFGVGQGYKVDGSETRYAVIDKSDEYRWSTGERGPNMAILHNPKDVTGNNALINSKLENANMTMRLATKEEMCLIKNVLKEGKAKFELIYDKREMIDFLDEEIRKFDIKSSVKSFYR